jgi:hypothetical protein
MAKKKLRPMGEILLDLETILQEMCYDHDLQWGDVLNMTKGYLEVHAPEAQEQYVEDGSSPAFYYGPAEGLKTSGKKKSRKK